MSKIECKCLHCGKVFYKYPSVLRHGGGKFCSISCGTTYRNIHSNPTNDAAVREKISKNHADVSGENNPMYGKCGSLSPSYIDGRKLLARNPKGKKTSHYVGILLANGRPRVCEICGSVEHIEVHHINGNHKDNAINNLMFVCRECHHKVCHKIERDERGKITTQHLNTKIKKGGGCCDGV